MKYPPHCAWYMTELLDIFFKKKQNKTNVNACFAKRQRSREKQEETQSALIRAWFYYFFFPSLFIPEKTLRNKNEP